MNDLLPIGLSAAVPLWIEELRPLEPEQRLARASGLADIIAEHGDIILYRGGKRGESARAFNALAEGLAIGAFQPGGVTAFGQHWCTDHAACEAAEKAAAEWKGEAA
jgi:hypothetical protein